MSKYSGHDEYLDPSSGVLRNRFGIASQTQLEETEAAFVAVRSYELSQKPLKGGFDLAHLQAIHRHLFGDVYEWAGDLRKNDIGKGGSMFAHHVHIRASAEPIFKQLSAEKNLAGLDTTAFSDRAAFYLGELNALHPFRDGNGRAQREFLSHLAHAAGRYIAWENISQRDMIQASVASFRGDTSRLAALIRRNLYALDA